MALWRALVVRGGWEGHRPVEATELFIPFLERSGYAVRVEESTQIYADAAELAGTDLIVQPTWTRPAPSLPPPRFPVPRR
ncbi:hypothetical protein [Solwaraspora sp. WMMA2065]|uniref:hypothetical protein n=1 Tax=Solwaraspora sp. WMMA2065 TaxID=3015166 RepID=UPI00259B68DF|nr:hypothetical protein [Solwaraspora sp. WMMA2065]WJK36358.1 hypothetical protein O7610_08410 [Solwaraspora sp. WMMA2065]